MGAGLSKSAHMKGVLHLEPAIVEKKVILGFEATKRLVDRRTFIVMDPGVVNEMSATVVVGSMNEEGEVKYHAVNHLFPTAGRYKLSGTFAYMRKRKNVRMRSLNAMCATGRTTSPRKYKIYHGNFERDGFSLLEENYSMEMLEEEARHENRKRSYWCSTLNKLLSLVDAMERRFCPGQKTRGAPILVIGRPTFNSNMPGHLPAAPRAFIEYLQRFFPVVLIDEYNTSKKCPDCHGYLQRHGRGGYREWRCTNCRDDAGQPVVVHKDISATYNMFKIFVYLMATGTRPPEFVRPLSQ